jgi:hypothetical protein
LRERRGRKAAGKEYKHLVERIDWVDLPQWC